MLRRPPVLVPLASLFLLVLSGCGGRAGVGGGGGLPVEDPEPLEVMSFNVRYGTADDGDDAWPLRRGLAFQVIGDHAPEVLSLQEALRFQIDEIRAEFGYLGEVGAGRDDGHRAGEYAAILFDHRRLELLASATSWLSDRPSVPGSVSWGNRIPRIVTWALLRDRASGRTFHVFNTHWDHESQPSRERSAEALVRLIERRSPRGPFLVTGDFNAGEDNPAIRALLSGNERIGRLGDPYRLVHPDAVEVGTFHGFTGRAGSERIDAIFTSSGWEVIEADIVRTHEGEGGRARYPSDHFPVTARLRFPPP
jgi:endonuclease/exonuclease/phosphatase family metal-dependent hydrolase